MPTRKAQLIKPTSSDMVGTRRSTPAGRTRGKDSSRRRTLPSASSSSKDKTPAKKLPTSTGKKAASTAKKATPQKPKPKKAAASTAKKATPQKPKPKKAAASTSSAAKKRSRASDSAEKSPAKRTKTTKKTPSKRKKEEEEEEKARKIVEEEEEGDDSKKPARLSLLEEACILAEETHKSGGKSKKERIADAKERAKKWADKDKESVAAASAEPKKKRGRKPGSKNKKHRADSMAASVAALIAPTQAPAGGQAPIRPMLAPPYGWGPPQMYGFPPGMMPPQVMAPGAPRGASASSPPGSTSKSPDPKGKKAPKKNSELSEAIEHAKREEERVGASAGAAAAAGRFGPPPPGYGWTPVYGPRPPGAFLPPGVPGGPMSPPTHTMPLAQAKAAAAAAGYATAVSAPSVPGVKNYTKSGKLKSMTPGAIKARERRAKKKLEHLKELKGDEAGASAGEKDVAERAAAAVPAAAVAPPPAAVPAPPPVAANAGTDSSEVTEKVEKLDIDSLARGKKHHLRVILKQDGVGSDISAPVIVVRGKKAGPVLGITAAMHGNELNGISVIHKLVDAIDVKKLSGTVVAVPVVNVPGYLANTREFSDGADLNRIMPGKEPGNASQVYAHRFMERVMKTGVEYLLDLHTASFGRINSYYIRADMKQPVVAGLAKLMDAEIILHNDGTEKTLRSAAENIGIHAMTVEVGDPQRFQKKRIRSCLDGIRRVMDNLKMLKAPPQEKEAEKGDEYDDEETVFCKKSYWLYTEEGGLLEVLPQLGQEVKKGERIALVNDVFGNLVREYKAPENGVVVGKSTNPVAFTGARILHLGIVEGQ